MALSGSRCRGLEQSGSDLDVVIEVKGNERVSVKEKLEEKRAVAAGIAGNTKEFDKWQGMGK